MKGYKTSKDYKRLKELLDGGHDVIVVGCRNNQLWIALGRDDGERYDLGFMQWSEEYIKKVGWTFERYCKEFNVEFIEPNL